MQKKAPAWVTYTVAAVTIVFFGGMIAYALYDRGVILTTHEARNGTFIDCKGRHFSASSRSRGGTGGWKYVPVAVSHDGHKALGSVFFKRSWCRNLIGLSTTVYVDPVEPDNNRIGNISQFWAIPIFVLIVLVGLTVARVKSAGKGVKVGLSLGGLMVAALFWEMNFFGLRMLLSA